MCILSADSPRKPALAPIAAIKGSDSLSTGTAEGGYLGCGSLLAILHRHSEYKESFH